MTTLRGHFDGKVIVPDEPVNLVPNQQLVIHIETDTAKPIPPDWSRFAGRISPKDAELMRAAIEENCERIDPDAW